MLLLHHDILLLPQVYIIYDKSIKADHFLSCYASAGLYCYTVLLPSVEELVNIDVSGPGLSVSTHAWPERVHPHRK